MTSRRTPLNLKERIRNSHRSEDFDSAHFSSSFHSSASFASPFEVSPIF